MSGVRPRLLHCFRTVFPDLSDSAIEQASAETLEAWDSVAAVTLMAVIEEEFSASIDLDMLPSMHSFDAIAAHLTVVAAGPAHPAGQS